MCWCIMVCLWVCLTSGQTFTSLNSCLDWWKFLQGRWCWFSCPIVDESHWVCSLLWEVAHVCWPSLFQQVTSQTWLEALFLEFICLFNYFLIKHFFLSDSAHVQTALAMVGKFGITASFAIIYIYSAELFPTVLRYSHTKPSQKPWSVSKSMKIRWEWRACILDFNI